MTLRDVKMTINHRSTHYHTMEVLYPLRYIGIITTSSENNFKRTKNNYEMYPITRLDLLRQEYPVMSTVGR